MNKTMLTKSDHGVRIACDGTGESDRPIDPSACSGRAIPADLSAVMDALPLPRTAAMGFSGVGVAELSWLRGRMARDAEHWAPAVGANAGGPDPDTGARIAANDGGARLAAIAPAWDAMTGIAALLARPVKVAD
ncbi:hypothetical protein HMH01_08305 [Halovulum dunhuangense]|uniref:Uncharacterized protein n=2 Tax=Halovulum dunhuangense TaxID=1505036 RepID=A0A849L2L7_9RHOB|nr:hypothetical protein [Halovulum dunhuangense]